MNPMKCPECQAVTEQIDGPTHDYILSSPGCWDVYTKVLEREYSDPEYMKSHRLTVDAYSCQHAGNDTKQSNQSVNVHLLGLYLAIELKMEFSVIPLHMKTIIEKYKNSFPRLKKPDFAGTLNVTDVIKAANAKEHTRLVQKWALEVWRAWKDEHEVVKNYARELNLL